MTSNLSYDIIRIYNKGYKNESNINYLNVPNKSNSNRIK